MSTVKITDLPAISIINSNTANTVLVGVDIPTNITGKITLTTLAAGLFSNNNLVVGNNHTVLPNVVAQFTGNSGIYSQVNTENINPNGSADYVITADDGTDTDFYLDMGLNGSTFSDPTSTYSATKAHDGYLYVASSGTNKGNLIIGTTNSTGKVNFVVGGLQTQNIVGYIDSTGIWSNSINSVVTANAASANLVINARVSANVTTLRSEISGNITTQNTFTQSSFDKANTAVQNTASIQLQAVTLSGNLIANSINQGIFVNNFTANTGTFSQDLTVSGTLTPANGIARTSRTLVGNQTAFNISFATDTVVRANISGSNLVITPTNFLPGKEVKVIVTNIAAGNRTITHGISAQNSTGTGATYTIPAISTAALIYTSFGTDVANTYMVGIV